MHLLSFHLFQVFGNEQFESVVSQLDKDVISKTAPQIKSMIEDARNIIEDRTGMKISDKIIPLGHSKSATFANNFSCILSRNVSG